MSSSKTVQVVHATAEFSEDSEVGQRPTKIVFEMDDRRDDQQASDGVVRVRRYPGTVPYLVLPGFGGGPMGVSDMGHNYVVTEGQLFFTQEVREKYVVGSFTMSGSDEYELPYPVLRDLNITINGTLYSASGNTISPRYWFDSRLQKIMFSQPVYGKVDYEFTTNYIIARYFPTKYADVEVYLEVDSKNYGDLLAFPRSAEASRGASVVTFSVQPPPSVKGEFEIYRVVSTGIINQEGSWEKPVGWPTTGTFIGKTDSSDILETGGSFLEVERVHIIGYLCLGDNAQTHATYGSKESVAVGPLAAQISNDKGASQQYSLGVGRQVERMDQYIRQGVRGVARASIREVRYDVPWAKPYENDTPEQFVVCNVTEANGVKITVANAIQYKRLLKVVANKPPLAPIGTADKSTINSVTYDDQANRVNAYLHQAYSMIDWGAIRASIPYQFSKEVYGTITFDPSVPVK